MSLTPEEQFKKFLESSKEILILIPENSTTDAVGSVWGLYFFLEKMGKISTIAFSNSLSEKFNFLPKPQKIQAEISGARDFVLSFDTTRNKILSARSEEKDGRFNIYVTPEKGSVDPRDFSFILAKFKYDLIITVGCSDLEKLGGIYLKNPDLFFEVPIVNIDNRSDNDSFGQINLIDVTASSCAEIIYDFIANWKSELIDKNISTCLMLGIIGATESFQKKNTTPKTLRIASELMKKEAAQQEIVRWLYKTQPLGILKLWGKSLSKIKWEEKIRLAWSELELDDFVQTRTSPKDLPQVIDKLEENYSEAKIFMLLYPETQKTGLAILKVSDKQLGDKLELFFGKKNAFGLWEIKVDDYKIGEIGQMIIKKIENALQ